MLDDQSAKGFTATKQKKVKQKDQKEAVSQIVTTIESTFDTDRADLAEKTWQELSKAKQKKVRTELQKTLPEAIRVQLDRNGWNGKAYKSFRNTAMHKLGFLTYPENLRTLNTFTKAHPSYQEQPLDTQKKIIEQLGT
jgi:hypothetical protein